MLSLIIPTYNRPTWIASLLGYLASANAPISLVILDSSEPDIAERNAELVNRLASGSQHIVYPKNVAFKDKLLDGLRRIDTEFCAFCADDDMVIPGALAESVRFLQSHPDYVGAHGLYFAYSGSIGKYFVDEILYCHRSLDQVTALERLESLFDDYQSNFYGVYRTKVQCKAFEVAVQQDNSLFFELMQSSHTAVSGKIARLPIIYGGRSRSASAGSPRQWHPVEWIAADPGGYLAGYSRYRAPLLSAILDAYPDHGSSQQVKQDTEVLFDLIHLRYSLDSIKIGGLSAAIRARMAHTSEDGVISAAFAGAYGPQLPAPISVGGTTWQLCQRLAQIMAPLTRLFKRSVDTTQSPDRPEGARQILNGKNAQVEFNDHVPAKLDAFDPALHGNGLESILHALDTYSQTSVSES
jgi:glycosyltransferase domain-containing protein